MYNWSNKYWNLNKSVIRFAVCWWNLIGLCSRTDCIAAHPINIIIFKTVRKFIILQVLLTFCWSSTRIEPVNNFCYNIIKSNNPINIILFKTVRKCIILQVILTIFWYHSFGDVHRRCRKILHLWPVPEFFNSQIRDWAMWVNLQNIFIKFGALKLKLKKFQMLW